MSAQRVDGCTFSGGRSPYLKPAKLQTHTLPSVEPLSCATAGREPSRLRIVSILQIITGLPQADSPR